jgi:peroxiredoxin Q/BCP
VSIEEGKQFPAFSLPDENGEARDLDALSGEKGLVLYVYPKDDTPGCTVEATDFRDLGGEFRDAGFHVAGLSKDSAASHCKFRDKYDLTFPLLTDAEGDFLSDIGAYGEKKMYGKVRMGIIRSTFVVAADGTLRKAYRNVRAKGHAERVLKEVRTL